MKSYYRFLKRNPYYTVINVLGLSVALMFVITIGDYIWRQMSVDSYHHDADRIYLVGDMDNFSSWAVVAGPAGEMFPDIEKSCSVIKAHAGIRTGFNSDLADQYSPVLLVESNFFEMFNYPFLEGAAETALSSPDQCIITKSAATRLFPDCDPVGKPLRLVGRRDMLVYDPINGDPYDTTAVFTVSAVIKDLDRTALPNDVQVIVNMQRHPQVRGYRLGVNSGPEMTFYQIRKGADLETLADNLHTYFYENIPVLQLAEKEGSRTTLTPLRKVMFAPQNVLDGLEKGDMKYIITLLLTIIAILLFAIINYINLTAANTGLRAREMATRQVLGSRQLSISVMLILEGILMVLVSFLVGLLLSFLFQDVMSDLFQGKILIKNDFTLGTAALCVAFVGIVGTLSGLIPALQMRSVNPVDVVKGEFRYKSKMIFSRVFIMVQNIITVALLAMSIVMTLQVNGLVNAPLGVNSKGLAYIAPFFATEAEVAGVLDRLDCVERIGRADGCCPLGVTNSMTYDYDTEGNPHIYYVAEMDQETFDIYGFDVLRDNGNAGHGKTYFSEQLLRELDLSPDAEEMLWASSEEPIDGVIRDFHFHGSVLNDVIPIRVKVVDPSKMDYPYLIVKTDGTRGAFSKIRKALYEAFPDKIKDIDVMIHDLEEGVYQSFKNQRNTMHIIYMFTGIALLLSILGILGLSLFFTRQHRNEIATRRAFGGSVNEVILYMLAKFCKPLLISFVAAVPLAYIVAERWLQDFSWRIQLRPWIFIAACAASLLTAMLSVLWHTISAVRCNPADSLKTE